MSQCKDCKYWKNSHPGNNIRWDDCTYYQYNKLPDFPIWFKTHYIKMLPTHLLGYVSPTQQHCTMFDKK